MLKGNAPNVFPRTSSTYKADMPIQLKGDARKTAVNLSVTIRKILHVDEVGKSMTVQFQSRRRWLDRQLTFQNLKLSEDLNIDPALSAESGETWFPWIDFYNIESNDKVSVSSLKSPNYKNREISVVYQFYQYAYCMIFCYHRTLISLAVTSGM